MEPPSGRLAARAAGEPAWPPPGGVWDTVYYLVCLAWIVVFVALVLGHYRTARVLAALAIVPGLAALLQAQLTGIMPAPFGPWIFWVLVDLAPVLAMAAFHRDAPPAARWPWLLALPAGYVLVYGPLLALQVTGNFAWLPDFPGLCCILVSLACLAHAPRARSRQAAGTGLWSLALVLLAAVAGAYRIVTLTDYLHDPHLINVSLAELLIVLAAVALVAPDAARAQAATPASPPLSPRHGCLGRTQDMPCQPPRRPLSVLASALAAGVRRARRCRLQQHRPARAGPCAREPATGTRSGVTDHHANHAQPAPTPAGECPAGSIALFGSEPNVLRAAVAPPCARAAHQGSTATPTPTATPATPPAPPAGVACYRPVGTPVTITSAAVSSVTTNRNQPGPAWYVFVVAFPTADVAALTALIRQAYDSGDAIGMSVAGKLWQAPQLRRKFIALRAEQINLLSRTQALQLYRLLVPSG